MNARTCALSSGHCNSTRLRVELLGRGLAARVFLVVFTLVVPHVQPIVAFEALAAETRHVDAADRRNATRSREGRVSLDACPASASEGADAIAVDAIVPPRRANCGVDVIARNADKACSETRVLGKSARALTVEGARRGGMRRRAKGGAKRRGKISHARDALGSTPKGP